MVNILDLLKGQMGSAVMGKVSEMIGEDSSVAASAMDKVLPALLGGMLSKGATKEGASGMLDFMNKEKTDGGMFDDLMGFMGDGGKMKGLMSLGSLALPFILGGKKAGFMNLIGKATGLGSGKMGTILSFAAPIIMNMIGKQVKSGGLGVSGLMDLLGGQKEHVAKAMPAGMGDLLGLGAAAKVEAPAAGGMMKWLIPVLGIAAAAWFFTKDGCAAATDTVATTVAAPAAKVTDLAKDATTAVTNIFGNVNDAALELLKGITFSSGSVGDQMMGFIKDGAKGDGRFRFNNLNFASGSDVIDAPSKVEVDNLAAILNAYTDVKVNIEGFTDSQGNADSNLALSQRRAGAVRTMLLAAGINDARITSNGFGAANPIADNATSEGRAENRRIEVVIVK